MRYVGSKGFPGGSMVKNLPANAGDTKDAGSIPGWEDPLQKEMATHSSILVWETPWTEEPGELQSIWLQRVRHNFITKKQGSKETTQALPGAEFLL